MVSETEIRPAPSKAASRGRASRGAAPAQILMAFVLALLALVPLLIAILDEPYWLDIVGRMMIFATAACTLGFLIGFGGMISLGHAVYLGIGAYSVGILAHHGVTNGWLQWAVAAGASATVALLIGALALRTRGVFFLMITLALAQVFYFVGVSSETYGGDDGLFLYDRSQFGLGIDLYDAHQLYYLNFGLLCMTVVLLHRFTRSRFGRVLRGCKENERRMAAMGYQTYLYRLAAFVIAGTLCGLAGAALANQAEFVTPGYGSWFRSGELLVMVILGGYGTVIGPAIGAFAFLFLEHILGALTTHWAFFLGGFLVLTSWLGHEGLDGYLLRLLAQARRR